MPNFGDAERKILSVFKIGETVEFENLVWKIEKVGKPTCNSGEPKTDVYVLLCNDKNKKEIKISYKKENADFLENKINCVRAEQLFGCKWKEVINASTAAINARFKSKAKIYKKAGMRTEKGAITLGWKFELLNKPGGDLSGRMNLTRSQVYDVYAGTNLSSDKKNAMVNNEVICNSGIANYILVSDTVDSAESVLKQMVTIEDYITEHPHIYFACKALNYRTFKDKYDGDRPLAVQVDWKVLNGKLSSNILYCHPLEKNGNEMYNQLLNCLKQLNIVNTDDINSNNANIEDIHQ
ncbi:MAG: hypothetical protein IJC05_02695 [Phascolarctobacterium sp.]|nr:hypothetical protein [Phascolarctobacterium sp.]